jgi:hypothetical protein
LIEREEEPMTDPDDTGELEGGGTENDSGDEL